MNEGNNSMAPKTKHIQCLKSCAGQMFSLAEDDIVDLDAGIAESLILGGLAVEVGEDGQPLPEEEKKEVSAKPKSKRAKES